MSQRFPQVRRLVTAALIASGLMLAGCGQTGPLYMPKRPAPLATPAAEVSLSAPVDSTTPTPTSSSSSSTP